MSGEEIAEKSYIFYMNELVFGIALHLLGAETGLTLSMIKTYKYKVYFKEI